MAPSAPTNSSLIHSQFWTWFLLFFSRTTWGFWKEMFHIFELSFLLIAFIVLLPPPCPVSLGAPPPLPPTFHIPSCRALSSNNFFVSQSDESQHIIVSKMEQRCPVPRGGGVCKEEGTGSCTCQADSGFEIPKEQNRTWEAICLQ